MSREVNSFKGRSPRQSSEVFKLFKETMGVSVWYIQRGVMSKQYLIKMSLVLFFDLGN